MCEDMCTYAWRGVGWDVLVLVLVIDREKEEKYIVLPCAAISSFVYPSGPTNEKM